MRERVLYVDASAGASGDMLLGALVDLGVPFARLNAELRKLAVDGFRLRRSRGTRGGVAGTSIRVVTPGDRGHRHFSDFRKTLERSGLSSTVKSRSLALLRRLFEAESRVHGSSLEAIHLHELGSLDTLVDVVGTVVGIDLLEVNEVSSSPVNVGGGSVATEHGRMPVPAPATTLLLEGAQVFSDGSDFERTTPTGALLVTGLARFAPFPPMTIRGVGYGLGTKDPQGERPNALRLVLGDRQREPTGVASERALVIETTVDDRTPQEVGYLSERLLALGAGVLDVFVSPVQMKKNRPGVNLTALVRPEERERVTELLFSEGATLGLRMHEVLREVLERRFVTVATPFGDVTVKEGLYAGRVVRRAPEYEDCRKLAGANGVPLSEVERAALASAGGKSKANGARSVVNHKKQRKRKVHV